MLLKILQFYGVFEKHDSNGTSLCAKTAVFTMLLFNYFVYVSKSVFFYDVFECLVTLGQTKTYFFPKTSVFTMHYEQFFKNISFYNKL